MKLSEANKDFVFTTRINLKEDESEFIVLCEPNMQQIKDIKSTDSTEKTLTSLEKIFPSCVVESSFTDEDDKPSTGAAIYGELKKSSTLMMDVLTIWLESLPFFSRLKKFET